MENKPKLCELLGVEVGERVKVGIFDFEFFVDANGCWRCDTENEDMYSNVALTALNCAINNPPNIRHKRKWTGKDIKTAKVIRYLFPDAESVKRRVDGDTVLINLKDKPHCFHSVSCDLFPSLLPGEFIPIDSILEGCYED